MEDTKNNGVLPNATDKNSTDNDFELECSDEEMRPKEGKDWEPSPEEIIELFEKIEKEKVLELEWTTPGRRPPTPVNVIETPTTKLQFPPKHAEEEAKSYFDFQEDMLAVKLKTTAIRPAGTEVGPRGSAKKKTTSLDAILSNMARHRKLDMMEDDDEDPLP